MAEAATAWRAAGTPLIRPVIRNATFSEPEAIFQVIARNGPYRWIGRESLPGPPPSWFRETWQYDHRGGDPARRLILDHPHFIDGSRDAFVGFEIVRPESVRINLMTAMSGEGAHVDLPYFRGLDHRNAPMHLLHGMVRSGLFERWMVNISSALAWLYKGAGGGLRFWFDGLDQPGARIAPPVDNRSFISDNQRMHHAVEAFGGAEGEIGAALTKDAEIAFDGEGWVVSGGGKALRRFGRDQVRINMLWKAVMLKDAQEARVYDEHLDDIDLEGAVDILRSEARRRGVDIGRSEDPWHDDGFARSLAQAFPPRAGGPYGPIVTDL